MKSKSKIQKQSQRKKSIELVETIKSAKENKEWIGIASILSGPRRKRMNLNLSEINKNSKQGDTILVPGKVLSQGEIDKKIKIIALSFSARAREKLLSSKCEILSILEEIKSNKEMKNIKILKSKPKEFTLSKTKRSFNK